MHERLLLSSEPLELQLYSGVDVIKEMTQSIAEMGSGDRIALTTMSFEPDEPLVADMLDSLHIAAGRGASIHLGIDAYTFLVDNTSTSIGPLLAPLPFRQEAFQRRQQAINELRTSGPHVVVNRLNDPERLLKNPFAGRSHIKAAVIGDRCFIIGPNLHQTERADVGVSFDHARIAEGLHNSLVRLITHGSTQTVFGGTDRVWQLDPYTQLLVDAGKPGQSLIMERALEIIEATSDEELVISLQYAPRGRIAEGLARAVLQRNVQLQALYNHPDTQGLIGGLAERLALRKARRQGMPNELFVNQLPSIKAANGIHAHAKVLANGNAVILGSNNFDRRGVMFGTAEMSLIREDDPEFARRVGELTCSLLGVSKQKRPSLEPVAA
jgi:phosphatidylserine/phosphatidylglycerophosphate/cardiolipin synthase-like enzyme